MIPRGRYELTEEDLATLPVLDPLDEWRASMMDDEKQKEQEGSPGPGPQKGPPQAEPLEDGSKEEGDGGGASSLPQGPGDEQGAPPHPSTT